MAADVGPAVALVNAGIRASDRRIGPRPSVAAAAPEDRAARHVTRARRPAGGTVSDARDRVSAPARRGTGYFLVRPVRRPVPRPRPIFLAKAERCSA